jgi:DNA-binding transcriptional LysR family regulator
VRLNAATPALDHLVAPLLADFLDAYPQVQLELTSAETIVDLIEERADVAIRIGQLADSGLRSRRLGRSRIRVLAAPGYLEKHGRPRSVEDLARHRLLGFAAPASLNTWPLRHGEEEGWSIVPHITASSGETVRHLALAGAGIASLSDFLSRADVAAGRLEPVLVDQTLPWTQPVWAVFYRQGALAPRVAALVDFLARRLGEVLEP